MSSQPANQPNTEDSDREARVADYLVAHPTFLERHPEVLAALEIQHPVDGAVSLIEHQVRVLRQQLDTERHRLTHLISRAREYEALSDRLHGLILQLISINDPGHLCHLLKEALIKEFRAEAVTLKLFPLADDGRLDPLTAAFHDFVDREHALCGPLDTAKADMLFGATADAVRAAALVPIRAGGQSGVLAIGSGDPERFHPDMGTDFLDRLGEIVSYKLKAVPLDPRHHC